MEGYKNWVRQNKAFVYQLESLANGLTWLLPERFSSSEIGPEAVTSFLGIITAINEYIIDTTPTQRPSSSPSFPYSLWVSALKEVETLVEVVAQQYYGDDGKWNFIMITEASKALLRLALFRNNGYKMLLHGGETPNVDSSSGGQSRFEDIAKPGGRLQNPWNLEGKALAALSQFGESARMLNYPSSVHRNHLHSENTKTSTMVTERPRLSSILSEKGFCGGLFLIGEALHILRPFIYVLVIRKFGMRSWIPWFVSLAVDLFGMSATSLATNTKGSHASNHIHFSIAEKDELKRRKVLWALYIMRDPFFTKYTRKRLEGTQKILEPVPVIGLLTEKLVDLVLGAQTRYTYMSGS